MGEEVEKSHEKVPVNLEENSKARLPNAPENLEGGDVGLKFQLKMLEFMDSMNQELKREKDKRAQKSKLSSSSRCKVLHLLLQQKVGKG